jgi:glycine C-acetyltransferase
MRHTLAARLEPREGGFTSTECNPQYFARQLMQEHGIWASAIWYIAKPRLRITVNALHTEEDMDRLVEGMVAIRDTIYKPMISA